MQGPPQGGNPYGSMQGPPQGGNPYGPPSNDNSNPFNQSQGGNNNNNNPFASMNNNGLGESKIVEMRKNSIPFTKKELSSFLNSI